MQIDHQHQPEDAHKPQTTVALLLGFKPLQRNRDALVRLLTSDKPPLNDDPHVVYRSNQNHSWSTMIYCELDHTENQWELLRYCGDFTDDKKSEEVKLDGFGGGEY